MQKAKNGQLSVDVVCIASNVPGAGVLDRAKKFDVPSFVLDHKLFSNREAFDEALLVELHKYQPEYIVLAGYMRVLSKKFLSAFPGRVINIHPALSPSFGGACGQRDAQHYGVKISGCTVHFVDEKVDHGAIIIQAAVPALTGENLDDLKARILAMEHRVYPQALQWLAQGRLTCVGRQVHLLPQKNAKQSIAAHGKHPHRRLGKPDDCLVWPPLEKGF